MYRLVVPKRRPWTKEWTHLRQWLCHLTQQISRIDTSTTRLLAQNMLGNRKTLLWWIFKRKSKPQQKQWSEWISWTKKKRNRYYLHNERLKLVQSPNTIPMKKSAHAKSLRRLSTLQKLRRNQHRRQYLLEFKPLRQKQRNQITGRNNWWHSTNQ